jgi:DNA adenine methylase
MYYPGNKNIPGLIQKIVNQIPPCTDFYEPFAGSAAVSKFLSVLPGITLRYHLNDIDPAVTVNNNYPAGSIVTSIPAMDIIQSIKYIPEATGIFFFIDPPYHHESRPNNSHLYKFEMTHNDHVFLLCSLLNTKYNCMIIHPQCDLYNRFLFSWRTVQVKVRYHNKTSVENLYMNYPRPVKLLTYGMYGTDCWDRQRIKRKGDRLIKKLLSLNEAERNYILDRIIKGISFCP